MIPSASSASARRSAAMHDGDFHIKRGSIAVPKHVQQRGLRPAEIEMIDDMKNADHRGKPARKASTFASLSCHSRTKRAHSSCAAASRLPVFKHSSRFVHDQPFEVARRAETRLKSPNIPSGSTANERMAA